MYEYARLKKVRGDGFYGLKEHVITYDPSTIRTCLSCFTSNDLTVFSMNGVVITHIAIVVYSLLLMGILAHSTSAYPDGTFGTKTGGCSE